MYRVLTIFCHPGQSARAAARDDLIRGPCHCAATLTDRMGPGSAPLRGLAGMTEWSVAQGRRA
jgi:hypothetical protein